MKPFGETDSQTIGLVNTMEVEDVCVEENNSVTLETPPVADPPILALGTRLALFFPVIPPLLDSRKYYILLLSTGALFTRLVYSIMMLCTIVVEDKITYELTHPLLKQSLQIGECYLMQCVFSIPMAAIIIVFAYSSFPKFPREVSQGCYSDYVAMFGMYLAVQCLGLGVLSYVVQLPVWDYCVEITLISFEFITYIYVQKEVRDQLEQNIREGPILLNTFQVTQNPPAV